MMLVVRWNEAARKRAMNVKDSSSGGSTRGGERMKALKGNVHDGEYATHRVLANGCANGRGRESHINSGGNNVGSGKRNDMGAFMTSSKLNEDVAGRGGNGVTSVENRKKASCCCCSSPLAPALDGRGSRPIGQSCMPRGIKMMNSFFYSKLVDHEHRQNTASYRYSNVRRWTRLDDEFGYDLMLMPIDEGSKHWTLGMIDFRACRVMHLDSMGAGGDSEVCQHLLHWVHDEATERGKVDSHWKDKGWRAVCEENAPV